MRDTKQGWKEYLFGEYFRRRDDRWYLLYRRYNICKNHEDLGGKVNWSELRVAK